MKINGEVEERIKNWIKIKSHYVGYPEMIQKNWWLDREGNLLYMYDMSLDHIKASAKLIERDLKNPFHIKDMYYSHYDEFIIKPAKIKKIELEEVLKDIVLNL